MPETKSMRRRSPRVAMGACKAAVAALMTLTVMLSAYIGYTEADTLDGGVYYAVREEGGTVYVSLRWAGSGSGEGLRITGFSVEGAKTFRIDYVVTNNEATFAEISIGASQVIMPVNAILNRLEKPFTPYGDIAGRECERAVRILYDSLLLTGFRLADFQPDRAMRRDEFLSLAAAVTGRRASEVNKLWGAGELTRSVTFGEACYLLSGAMDFTMLKRGHYMNLNADHRYFEEVRTIFNAGLFTVDESAYKSGFSEDKPLSRGDAAIMLSRAMVAN